MAETVRAALVRATGRIGWSATARLDAELLMADALEVSRETLLLRHLDDQVPPGFEERIARRERHEPIAYITGWRDFWTITLEVGPGALVPRADSETLIEAAVAHFTGTTGPHRILDLGTGPGTLLLAALAEWPDAMGVGVDCSEAALDYARRNATRLGLGDRARFQPGGWEGPGGTFDLILCNPPYVATGDELPPEISEHEPACALFAGPDGLDDYRRIGPVLGPQLAPGGVACIEIGATQAPGVSALFAAEWLRASVRKDLAGKDRCVVVQHSGALDPA